LNKQTVAILVIVNFALILLGALTVYYDLYARHYTTPPYEAVEPPTAIEWSILQYRPTLIERDGSVVKGSWTFDFFQLITIATAIGDILWIISNRRSVSKVQSQ
jgi:hypothetical protein